MLFDWLVAGHVIETNPAHAVRGPKHVVKKGKAPVLTAEEARILLDSIDTSKLPIPSPELAPACCPRSSTCYGKRLRRFLPLCGGELGN